MNTTRSWWRRICRNTRLLITVRSWISLIMSYIPAVVFFLPRNTHISFRIPDLDWHYHTEHCRVGTLYTSAKNWLVLSTCMHPAPLNTIAPRRPCNNTVCQRVHILLTRSSIISVEPPLQALPCFCWCSAPASSWFSLSPWWSSSSSATYSRSGQGMYSAI